MAWRFGFQPQLGPAWFEIWGGPVYYPPALFWWWYFYDAYAPRIFAEGGIIAASGGFMAIGTAIILSVMRAREAADVDILFSSRALPDAVSRQLRGRASPWHPFAAIPSTRWSSAG